MQEAGVRRVAIGIGSGIDISELRQIASSNEDVLQVSRYDELYGKLERIMKMACEEQYPGTWAFHASETSRDIWNGRHLIRDNWELGEVSAPACFLLAMGLNLFSKNQ